MESVTTMLLTFLFVPKFKKKFAKALVRHYDAVARFPETLPWPGVCTEETIPITETSLGRTGTVVRRPERADWSFRKPRTSRRRRRFN
jgi:hypothetical protein